MSVSFVNAGLLSITQSATIIMGADIGTTITPWIIDLFGFKADMAAYALIIVAVAAPLLFLGKPKLTAIATMLIGFALLFIGLEFLKQSLPAMGPDSSIAQFFARYGEYTFWNTMLFVALGLFVAANIHSSAATIALVMTLVVAGLVSFEASAGVVIGANIGTTVTAELAAMMGNVHAKRTARLNTLFKVIGAIWIIPIFPFFLSGVAIFMGYIGLGNPFENPQEYANTGLAILHTMFNVVNVLLLIWFIPSLVKLVEWMIKPKADEDVEFRLDYIKVGHLETPEISLILAKKEIAKFGEITSRMSQFSKELLFETNRKNQQKLIKKISKYEEITDRVEVEIANYLNKLSGGETNIDTTIRIRGMNSIVNDLERIGDIFYQIAKSIEKKYGFPTHKLNDWPKCLIWLMKPLKK